MDTIFDFVFSLGMVPTVLLVAYGPLLVWLGYILVGKGYEGIPKSIRVSFLGVLSFSFLMSLLVLFLYAITKSGI